jgi:hypothetical protein
MTKYNTVVCCYDRILVSVAAYVTPEQRTAPHTPKQELHMQPHLPIFYHNNTQPYCILSF